MGGARAPPPAPPGYATESFTSGVSNLRPAKAFHPARHLLLSPGLPPFIVTRPATFFLFSISDMQQQTAEMILTLFFDLHHQFGRKKA